MTWSVSMSGHVQDKDEEAKVIDAVRAAVRALPAGTTPSSARMYSQHHGQIDLLADDDSPPPAVL